MESAVDAESTAETGAAEPASSVDALLELRESLPERFRFLDDRFRFAATALPEDAPSVTAPAVFDSDWLI